MSKYYDVNDLLAEEEVSWGGGGSLPNERREEEEEEWQRPACGMKRENTASYDFGKAASVSDVLTLLFLPSFLNTRHCRRSSIHLCMGWAELSTPLATVRM